MYSRQDDPVRARLYALWTELQLGIDVMPVIDQLADLYPPGLDEYQAIVSQRTVRDKNRRFLSSIESKGPDAVVRMIKALATTGQLALAQKFADGPGLYIDLPRAGASTMLPSTRMPNGASAVSQLGPWTAQPPQAASVSQGSRTSRQQAAQTDTVHWRTPLSKVRDHFIWRTVCRMLRDEGNILIPGWGALLKQLGFVGIQAQNFGLNSANAIEDILDAWCSCEKDAATLERLARHLEKLPRRDVVDAMETQLSRRTLKERLSADEYQKLHSKRPDEVTETFLHLSSELSVSNCNRLAELLGVDHSYVHQTRYNFAHNAAGGNRELFARWQQIQRSYNLATLIEKLEMIDCWNLAKDVAKQHGC